MTQRAHAALALVASAVAFAAAVFLRMRAAYGPLNLSIDPGDWTVLGELLRHGQIATGVVLESVALGVVAAAVPWVAFGLTRRRGNR